MQDGKAIPADGAGEWLRNHVAGGSEPEITIEWTERHERDDAGFARFLAALFTPLPDSPKP
jgi:hypothetical protein